ncbi:uncharacterized protein FA14DRAFT_182782 [Meira miltonrushii]|uniref:Uncharacterized protein n=1 Tax=Meira miltonrushii TaxID=1280837 RepID=A0A316V4A2_9BASI|nr:uncharacterized protein FA14DRAFT_182782 [Meira miltonrushii]PWN31351.1 hypothetical protein FA14DRAFT_182782 [Meira miltonrushii]
MTMVQFRKFSLRVTEAEQFAIRAFGKAAGLNKGNGSGAPSPADLAQWNERFNFLIQRLAQPPEQLVTLFPSTRAKTRLPFGAPALDVIRKAQLVIEGRDIWQLMTVIAVSANMTQQQVLVTELRKSS